MKKNITLLAIAFAMTMLVACSNDKEPINETQTETNTESEKQEITSNLEVIPEIDKEIICASFLINDCEVEEDIIRIESQDQWEDFKEKSYLSWPEAENIFDKNVIYIVQKPLTDNKVELYINKAVISDGILNVETGVIDKSDEKSTEESKAAAFYIFRCDKNVSDIKVINAN